MSTQHSPQPPPERDPEAVRLTGDEVIEVIRTGEMCIRGRLPRSSNATLLATVAVDELELPVVYKPRRGERPLWDFPRGTLCNREVAAYVVSEAIGWGIVPPTLLRECEYGVGSVQLYVAPHDDVDVVALVEEGDESLVPMAVLDLLLNNADRKVSHCLVDELGRMWGIDHGLTFSDEPGKLRTVLWHWIGEPIPGGLLGDVRDLASRLDDGRSDVRRSLDDLLGPDEVAALRARVGDILADPHFPEPDPYGPAVPWPPY